MALRKALIIGAGGSIAEVTSSDQLSLPGGIAVTGAAGFQDASFGNVTVASSANITALGNGHSFGNTTISNLTISGSLKLPVAVANSVFAGPTSGAPAPPTFRALDPSDLPNPLTLAGFTITNTNFNFTPLTINAIAGTDTVQEWQSNGTAVADLLANGTLTLTGSVQASGSNNTLGNTTISNLNVTGSMGNTTISNLTVTGSLALPAQALNTFLAGPASGTSGAPAFRTLTAADLPTVLGNITIGNLTVTGNVQASSDGSTLANSTINGVLTINGTPTTSACLVVQGSANQTTGNIQIWKKGTSGVASVDSNGFMNVQKLQINTVDIIGTNGQLTSSTFLPGGNWIGATNGSSTLATTLTLGSATGVYVNTGANITLPSAGTYEVTALVRVDFTVGTAGDLQFSVARFLDASTSTAIANSETMLFLSTDVVRRSVTVPMKAYITVAASKTINLQAMRSFSAATGPTVQFFSDANGRVSMFYTRIA